MVRILVGIVIGVVLAGGWAAHAAGKRLEIVEQAGDFGLVRENVTGACWLYFETRGPNAFRTGAALASAPPEACR